MTSQELIDYIRRDLLRDKAQPYLWSDELLLLYINEAVTLFARGTYSSTVNQNYDIELAAGESEYPLPEEILWIASMRLDGMSGELRNYTHRVIPSHLETASGRPTMFIMDEGTQLLRVYAVPDQAYTAKVRAAVLPPSFTAADTPPVKSQYHLSLADHVVARCLANNEIEGAKSDLAPTYEDRWGRTITEAKREFYRIRMGNNARVMQNWTGKR